MKTNKRRERQKGTRWKPNCKHSSARIVIDTYVCRKLGKLIGFGCMICYDCPRYKKRES